MALDSTVPPSIVGKDHIVDFPKDTADTEVGIAPGSGIEKISFYSVDSLPSVLERSSTWSYLFLHNMKVGKFEATVRSDPDFIAQGFQCFVHRSVVYRPRANGRGVERTERPSVSGLVFLQGRARALQRYLDEHFRPYHLVNDRSTHRPAVIPDSQMQPFRRVLEEDPTRIRILEKPAGHYAEGRVRLRVLTGILAGQEGYLIRIARDRKLVIDFGGLAVAIGGVHGEQFEEIKSLHHNRP